eukprot:353590-Chlamydomonas_euryale.AAC.9
MTSPYGRADDRWQEVEVMRMQRDVAARHMDTDILHNLQDFSHSILGRLALVAHTLSQHSICKSMWHADTLLPPGAVRPVASVDGLTTS